MTGTGPGDAHAVAVQLLEHCVEALDTIPDTEPHLQGAPERSFVSPGRPVWDCCEMLAVHIEGVSDAPVGPQGGIATGKRAVFNKLLIPTYVATIGRCIPTGADGKSGGYKPPSTASLDAAAEQINADGWALENHLFNLIRAGEFLTLCSHVFFDGLVPSLPTGGCGGWTLVVRVQLDGYEDSIGS